jgi:hypothetical protein
MAGVQFLATATYTLIGDTHVLIHGYSTGILNLWMLVDLEELSKESGRSVKQLLAQLRRNVQVQ